MAKKAKVEKIMYGSMKLRGAGKFGIVEALGIKGLVGVMYVFDTPENAHAYDNEANNQLVAIQEVKNG